MQLVPAVTAAFGELRSENREFEASFGYITKPCLEIKTKSNKAPQSGTKFLAPWGCKAKQAQGGRVLLRAPTHIQFTGTVSSSVPI